MADGGYTILHRKDERGVIVESGTFGPDDEVPEGFGAAEYQPIYAPREDHQEPVAESVLTPWESPIGKGTWVENRPEDAEVDQGTPIQARGDEELSDAEREALEAEADSDEGEDGEPELSEGSPREAREQSEDGELTGAEEEADEALSEDSEDDLQPPPRGGAGSGLAEWADYADRRGVDVPENSSRDEIVAAIQKAGHPV